MTATSTRGAWLFRQMARAASATRSLMRVAEGHYLDEKMGAFVSAGGLGHDRAVVGVDPKAANGRPSSQGTSLSGFGQIRRVRG